MSGRHWTPYQINIVLWHHGSRAPFPTWQVPGYEPELANLVLKGVVVRKANPIGANPSGIFVTEFGHALVEMWLQTPLPRVMVIDPRTGKEVLIEGDPNFRSPVWPEVPPGMQEAAGAAGADIPDDAPMWIDWAGGNCPVGLERCVEVRLRDGSRFTSTAGQLGWHRIGAEDFHIVAYRVHREAKDPRDFQEWVARFNAIKPQDLSKW